MFDPLEELLRETKQLLGTLSAKLGIPLDHLEITKAPPRHGYLAASLHGLIKEYPDLPKALEEASGALVMNLVGGLHVEGGFLNIRVNEVAYAKLVLETIESLGDRYGWSPRCPGGSFIIEHTSANPAKPMHVGHGRNAVLGDSLARLLRFCGASVRTHFYINDCGDQIPYVGLGYLHVKDLVARRVREGAKPDHVIGLVYSAAYAVGEVKRLTAEIERKGRLGDEEGVRELIGERDEWLSVLKGLRDRDSELVDALVSSLGKYGDLASVVRQWARAYEEGDEYVKSVIREAVSMVLEGFRSTLSRLDIHFDSWDWESEVSVYNGATARLLRELVERAPAYVERVDGALVFMADKYAEDHGLWEELKLPRFIPRATLVRSDGTTLYLTRDVAYALWCWSNFNFDKLIRVIGSEQTHPQAQLRLILHAAGYRELARKIIHYSYEMVNVSGLTMSGRKGIYVTLDGVIDEAKSRILNIVSSRFPPGDAAQVAEAVAVGAIRYALLSVSPNRPLTFSWDKVLNLRQNSGPFVQYTYVRTLGILEKAGPLPPLATPPSLAPEEVALVLFLGEYPGTVAKAANELRLEGLVEYSNKVALAFNSFYEKYPVLNAEQPLRSFRLHLVNAVKLVLGNLMNILGIPRLSRM